MRVFHESLWLRTPSEELGKFFKVKKTVFKSMNYTVFCIF